MNIATYLQQYGYPTAAVLAQRAGTRLIYLKQIAWGLRRPSAELALRLEHASGGLLAAYETRPDLPWPHAPRPAPAPEFGGASPVAPAYPPATGAFSNTEPASDP